ncbi:alanine:cation symporter family protein [Candidatus Anaplasma sp. TIGMIC]|uniref:alanine:cation symporter family protein n=1 Tax=Candidatus Anaplasma sp. TIGMIC TaxID=3020713 RepID=UPI00232D92BF|nr:alanine:cation symporter family protein [Candidatus Anaplasma sp. TIGMIC]MDB1135233.1 alanine:cation symporter family protein [Candidatus Anaplasma sp. TIGMIC]
MYFIKLFFSVPAIALLLFTGFRLSFASRWLQVRKFNSTFSNLCNGNGGGFNSITALCAIVGGNLGVGNLSGTAVALRSGGPGFIVWMIAIIALTSIIKYVTCYLSIMTKENVNGRVYGGPVVYLQRAFKTKWATYAVATVTVICAVTVGNLVQVNSLSISMHLIGQPPIMAGIIMVIILAFISTMNSDYLGKGISKIVPAMTVFYITLATVTLSKFGHNIVPSLKLILHSSLSVESFRHGAFLAFVAETLSMIQVGALRGIFATDIGLGLEGTVHSMVKSNGPADRDFAVEQSLISLISPYIVAMVTFITTMVLLTTNVWTDLGLESTNMCFTAFTRALGSGLTEYALILLVFCFSLTTILTWFLCSREVIAYVSNGNNFLDKCWASLFVTMIPLGALGTVKFLWDLADISTSISIIINTLGILIMLNKYRDAMFTNIGRRK